MSVCLCLSSVVPYVIWLGCRYGVWYCMLVYVRLRSVMHDWLTDDISTDSTSTHSAWVTDWRAYDSSVVRFTAQLLVEQSVPDDDAFSHSVYGVGKEVSYRIIGWWSDSPLPVARGWWWWYIILLSIHLDRIILVLKQGRQSGFPRSMAGSHNLRRSGIYY
jgi:hypothetical protein